MLFSYSQTPRTKPSVCKITVVVQTSCTEHMNCANVVQAEYNYFIF